MAWAEVEHILHEMFVVNAVHRSRNKNRYVVARGVWSAVLSFEARLKMVDASLLGNLWDKKSRRYLKAKDDWRLLYNYIVKMSSLRNEIAHGTIMNYDNKEMKLTPYATTIPPREGISLTEVQNRANLFVELSRALGWLDFSFSMYWKPKLKRTVLAQQPIPDLVLRLRKQAAQSS